MRPLKPGTQEQHKHAKSTSETTIKTGTQKIPSAAAILGATFCRSAAVGSRPLEGELEVVELSLLAHSFQQKFSFNLTGIDFRNADQPSPENHGEN